MKRFVQFTTLVMMLFSITAYSVAQNNPIPEMEENPIPEFADAYDVPNAGFLFHVKDAVQDCPNCPNGVCPVPESPVTTTSPVSVPSQWIGPSTVAQGSATPLQSTSSIQMETVTETVYVPTEVSYQRPMRGMASHGSQGGVMVAAPTYYRGWSYPSYSGGGGSSGNGVSGRGFFGAQRGWWPGKRLGVPSPGERRAARNPRFGMRSGITSGHTVSVSAPTHVSTHVPTPYGVSGWYSDSGTAYGEYTWPGSPDVASLRSHLRSGPHWADTAGLSSGELVSLHDDCHINRLGDVYWSADMIHEANQPVSTWPPGL